MVDVKGLDTYFASAGYVQTDGIEYIVISNMITNHVAGSRITNARGIPNEGIIVRVCRSVLPYSGCFTHMQMGSQSQRCPLRFVNIRPRDLVPV
jgi:hypothetical protein